VLLAATPAPTTPGRRLAAICARRLVPVLLAATPAPTTPGRQLAAICGR
jgi:hypothetical protein